MSLQGIKSYIFGAGTDTPTYEEVKAKRALQQRLTASLAENTPQNIGQGIHAIGKAIGARRAGNVASVGEEAGRKKAEEQFSALQALFGQSMGGGTDMLMGSAGNDTLQPEQTMRMEGFNAPAGNPMQNAPMRGLAPSDQSPLRNAGGLPASIVRTESGGNWNALNSEGYGGRGQFGKERLADAARAGIIPPGMTGAQYSKAPPEVQLAVENWHKQDILKDLGQYVGVDIDGPGGIPPLTENSILGVAHLGGTGGARKFIESGGRYNPSDSNGTSLADYATTHAGGGTISGGGGSSTVMGGDSGGGPDMAKLAQIAQFMDNPYATDGQKALAGLMMQRLTQQPGQMSQLEQIQLQKAQLELQQMQNPAAPDRDIRTGPDGIDRYVDTGEPVFPDVQVPEDTGPNMEAETDLRKEYMGLPQNKAFSEQAQAFGRIVASARDPSPAGDLSLIFNFMKVLDPGSVVRESEFATAQNAAAVPDQVRNMYNRVISGERLNPEQRQNFVAQAAQLYREAERGQAALQEQYAGTAEAYGADPGRTLPDLRYRQQGAPVYSQRPTARPGGAAPTASEPAQQPAQAGGPWPIDNDPPPEGWDAETWKWLSPDERSAIR